MQVHATTRAFRERAGLSLIELLVVIGIIATLASLSILVMTNITASARESATIVTVVKVGRLVDDRASAFDRSFRGGRLTKARDTLERLAKQLMLPDLYGSPRDFADVPVEPRLLDAGAAEAIARKVVFRRQFPQQYSDMPPEDGGFGDNDIDNVLTGSGVPNGIPDIVERRVGVQLLEAARRRLNDPNAPLAAAATEAENAFSSTTDAAEKAESSELLYFTLTKLAVFGASPVGDDEFLTGEVADTDNDGMLEFVDSWGEPLRFYRWPTRLIDPDYNPSARDDENVVTSVEREVASLLIRDLPPEPPETFEDLIGDGVFSSRKPRDPLKIDPDDPIGRIGFELARLNGVDDAPDLSLQFNEAGFHSPDVFHTPLVVSSGPDRVLGLFEPTDTANLGNLAQYSGTVSELSDNITNRNRRAGGLN